jgi:hypothetical protein
VEASGIDIEEIRADMTLEEKCAQLGGVWYSWLLVDGQLDKGLMERHLANGIGHITRIAGTGFEPVRAAEAIDRIQHFLEERTRLGIAALAHEEALSGLMAHRLRDPSGTARTPRYRPPVSHRARRRHVPRRSDIDNGDDNRRRCASRSKRVQALCVRRPAAQGVPHRFELATQFNSWVRSEGGTRAAHELQ